MDAGTEITDEHVDRLTDLLREGSPYVQRCVERLEFPERGQRWTRDLQIQIPPQRGGHRRVTHHVVSLGSFRRRRMPDITAVNDRDERLNLLTRAEHGQVLSNMLLKKHLYVYSAFAAEPDEAPPSLEKLHRRLQQLFTSVGDIPNRRAEVRRLGRIFGAAYQALKGDDAAFDAAVAGFGADVFNLLDVTYYLCWVAAQPGDVINISVSWTAADHRPKRKRVWELWRSNRLDFYRLTGLAPLNYGFVPNAAASYYFMLQPPESTKVALLACGRQSTLTRDSALDSSLACIHLHASTLGPGEPNDAPPGGAEARGRGAAAPPPAVDPVFAFLRPDPREHKLISASAALTLLFVLLIGFAPNPTSIMRQSWVLIAPTVITAFIAQQQRHYYAVATRWQRGLLWIYLTLSVGFLVAVSFSLAGVPSETDASTFACALALTAASAGVVVWYWFIGHWYERRTHRWTRNALDEPANATIPTHALYERAVVRYCKRVAAGAGLAALLAPIVLASVWPHQRLSPPDPPPPRLSGVKISVGTVSPHGHPAPVVARFKLGQASLVTVTVARLQGGVQRGNLCEPPSRSVDRRAPACDLLYAHRAELLPEGAQEIAIERGLPAGRFRFIVTARPDRSDTQDTSQTLVRRKVVTRQGP